MGLSSLPAPSEGVLCVLLVNTVLSISIFKGIVRTILHIVGIHLSSSSTTPSSPDPSQTPPESFEFHLSPAESYIEEFRSRTPTLRFDSVCCCKRPEHDCSVCLTQFEPDSEINRLSCGHLFHKVCLEKWLDYWNITCPLCRTPLMPEDDAPCFQLILILANLMLAASIQPHDRVLTHSYLVAHHSPDTLVTFLHTHLRTFSSSLCRTNIVDTFVKNAKKSSTPSGFGDIKEIIQRHILFRNAFPSRTLSPTPPILLCSIHNHFLFHCVLFQIPISDELVQPSHYLIPTIALQLRLLLFMAELAFTHPHHLFRPNTPFIIPPKRHTCHHVPLHSVFRIMYCMKDHKSVRNLAALSTEKGKSATSVDELCKIVWTVEADLEDGHLLYITGDPAVLGCWKPNMAVLMSPTEHVNIWKAEFQIAFGLNFKYNYFIKGTFRSSNDILWRPGPAFSLSVPLTVLEDNKLVVRDSWIRSDSQIASAHAWSPFTEETYLLEQPFISFLSKDQGRIESLPENDILKFEKLGLEDHLLYDNDDMVIANHKEFQSNILSENYQPVEEPWLHLFPSIVSKDKMESNETAKEQVKLVDREQLLLEESGNIMSKDSISTIILINSSICTMQRIAVLEDEKLVELLLEPVKSNVQCDSVYVGVVTKLVPHMGGAFVCIGNSRSAFMDIKQNKEPFIFPPFRQRTKKQELDLLGKNDHTSHVVDVSDGISDINSEDGCLKSVHNDYDEHEGDDDFYISEVLKENVNGSMVDDEVEADFEDDIEGSDVHIDADTNNSSLALGVNGSVNSHILQTKDTKRATHPTSGENKWIQVRKGTKIVVQVVKEDLGTKGPTLTAYPKLRSRFWVLIACCDKIGVSKKISGVERTRLKVIAKTLQPEGFGLTVRTVAAGHSFEELQKDLEGLLSTWKNIMEHAKSAALAADEGVEGAVPVILHRAMGQTLSVVQDYFNENVKKMVVDSPRTFYEVTNYLQEIAPDLCDRVELYDKKVPLFDEFNIEGEIDNILSKRVPLANGGSLIIEQTEALVSIDVNGGHGMLGRGNSQQQAILDVNLAAAKQIARELRLRDIGGIIVVDFIDMTDEANKRLVYEEVKKAIERDKSMVKVSELSRHGLMEITRKRVRPSVTFMISEPCACCHATGRVEALETSFSKIEQQVCRLLVTMDHKADPEKPKTWPKFILRVDHYMCEYLTAGKKTRLATLSSSLKVWILLKVARGFTRGEFEVKQFNDDKVEKNQHNISMLRSSEARTKKPGQNVTLVQVKKSKARGK
ncbi:hypothetical protein VNO78_31212 [Psophocarpus tetragonolobus]|uniref:Uncharacterized protein n=1 Tax=Psophocarpus tetragonolobus TaxID=3891 RepID=A0AAN9RYM0_PSOTE